MIKFIVQNNISTRRKIEISCLYPHYGEIPPIIYYTIANNFISDYHYQKDLELDTGKFIC